jgi:hypothetical protein
MAREIKELLGRIEQDKVLMASFEKSVLSGGPVNITGLCEQQKGYLIAALAYKFGKKPVVIVSDVTRAKALSGGIAPFAGKSHCIQKYIKKVLDPPANLRYNMGVGEGNRTSQRFKKTSKKFEKPLDNKKRKCYNKHVMREGKPNKTRK